jgi:hypothetical protein
MVWTLQIPQSYSKQRYVAATEVPRPSQDVHPLIECFQSLTRGIRVQDDRLSCGISVRWRIFVVENSVTNHPIQLRISLNFFLGSNIDCVGRFLSGCTSAEAWQQPSSMLGLGSWNLLLCHREALRGTNLVSSSIVNIAYLNRVLLRFITPLFVARK